jgi:hypothetical protein
VASQTLFGLVGGLEAEVLGNPLGAILEEDTVGIRVPVLCQPTRILVSPNPLGAHGL